MAVKSEDGHVKVENGSVDGSGHTGSESAVAEEGEGMSEAHVANQRNTDEKQSSQEVKVENQTPNCKQFRLVTICFVTIVTIDSRQIKCSVCSVFSMCF